MSGNEDAEAVERVLAGERDAFAGLVRRHHQRVLGLCLSLTGNPADADEAAQEALLKAYRSLSAYRSEASFSTWLHRIAYNACMDFLRARSRRPAESWDALLEAEGERLERLLQGDPDPAKAAEAADLVARLLALLPEEQREVLVLCEMQGFTYEEIAASMGCSVDSVKARLRRARRTLEEGLRHFMPPKGV
ncbi:MAG: sigma-70 family RNA polymerase sigma factor [Elusimicrobia bacterium]|nr:sigma-70 family RNA polymerase sigma factor [Elusimicrobiota bacterium]